MVKHTSRAIEKTLDGFGFGTLISSRLTQTSVNQGESEEFFLIFEASTAIQPQKP